MVTGTEMPMGVSCANSICFLALTRFFIPLSICLIMKIRSVIFMNPDIIARYLQFLRKSHNYTQEDLAGKLNISRQAVSKWETGTAIPDLEVLLKISRLYGITVNDILEPHIPPLRITDFEQIAEIPEKELQEILKQFDADSLAAALMGASPEINSLCERLLPDTDFETIRNRIGRIRIEAVEDMQNQVITMINLRAIGR